MSFSCCYARSIALMAVETCSEAVLALCAGHGKSPCFLRCSVLKVVGVDGALLVSASIDGDNLLERAF